MRCDLLKIFTYLFVILI